MILKYFIFLLLTITSLTTDAQTSERLDQKNGFLEFKFGTSPLNYRGKIEKHLGKEVVKNNETYIVTSSDYKQALGYDVDVIELSFVKNKLWAININFIQEDVDKAYPFLLYKLRNIFGNSFSEISPDESQYLYYLNGERWKGANTSLDIIKVKIKDTKKYYVSIYYRNKSIEKQAIIDEF